MTLKVLLTDSNLPGTGAEDELSASGHQLVRPSSSAATDILAAGADASALLVQWTPITAALMDGLPKLRIISRLGIGYDMIDVDAASRRGIAVANTPRYCIEEVASHTIAMIMNLVRGISFYDRETRSGGWRAVTDAPAARRPSTLTIGVLGFGRIGQLVAQGCAALGFAVLVSDPYYPAETVTAKGFTPVSADDLYQRADVLTLHAPLTDDTRHIVNDLTIERMKPGLLLVNTCRGGLVDEQALVRALASGHIAAVALDVFENEPISRQSPLLYLPNVVMSPHAAWYSPEALLDLPREAATNIVDFFAGRPVASIVNPSILRNRTAS